VFMGVHACIRRCNCVRQDATAIAIHRPQFHTRNKRGQVHAFSVNRGRMQSATSRKELNSGRDLDATAPVESARDGVIDDGLMFVGACFNV